MAGAADGQPFGDALDDAQDNRLENLDHKFHKNQSPIQLLNMLFYYSIPVGELEAPFWKKAEK